MIRVSTNKRGISSALSNGLYLIVKLKAWRFKHAYVTHVNEENTETVEMFSWRGDGRVKGA